MTHQQNTGVAAAAAQAWRLWLLTGTRRGRIDRRRIRGAHLGLKRLLVEDMAVRGEPAYGWKEFSDAMLRQAVGDAVRMLPEFDGEVLKLAYFAGCSNREIARECGMTEAAVASRLRRALDFISERIQRGGVALRRAAYAVAGWFGARSLSDLLHHAAAASAVAAVAMVVVASGPAPPPGPPQPLVPPQAHPPVALPVRGPDAQPVAPAHGAVSIPATAVPSAPAALDGTQLSVTAATALVTTTVSGVQSAVPKVALPAAPRPPASLP